MVLSICLDWFCNLTVEYTPTAIPFDSLSMIDTYTYKIPLVTAPDVIGGI